MPGGGGRAVYRRVQCVLDSRERNRLVAIAHTESLQSHGSKFRKVSHLKLPHHFLQQTSSFLLQRINLRSNTLEDLPNPSFSAF